MSHAPTASNSTRKADAALLLVAVMWGGSYLAAQEMTHVAAPPVVLALRFVPSLVVLAVAAAIGRSRFSRHVLGVGLTLGVLQAVTLVLETYSVTRTTASNAGVLVSLAVITAPLFEGIVGGQRLPRTYFAAAGASVVGVALLIGPSGFTSPNLGDLMVLAAACTRAGLMVASARMTHGRHFDAVALNVVQTGVNAILFAAIAGPALGPRVSHLDGRHWLVLAFLSLGCTCAAFLLQLWAIHHTSATRASLLMGTEPVWALVVGIVIGGDRLGLLGVVGALVVVASTWWGQRIESDWRAGVAQA